MAKELLVGVAIGATLKAGFTTVFGRAERTAKALGREIDNATKANEAFGRSLRAQSSLGWTDNLRSGTREYAAMSVQIHRATQAQNNLNKALAAETAARERRRQLRTDMAEGFAHATAAAAPIIGSVQRFMAQEDASIDLKVAMMQKDGGFGRFAEIDRLTGEWGTALPGSKADFTRMVRDLKSQGISDGTVVNGGGLATAQLNTVMGGPISDGSFFAKSMEAHGIKESELLASADLTQRAAFAGGLSKEDMQQSMSFYAAKVNSLGLTGLENQKQIYAIQNLAANKGLERSNFGTNFSMMLSQLSRGPKMIEEATRGMKAETRQMLESSGAKFEFFNPDGSMKSLRDVTGILESEFGKIRARYGDRGVLDVADAIFGQEGGRVASILSQAGLSGFDGMIDKMDAQASMQQRIEVRTSSLSSALESLGGVLDQTAAAFGETFAPDIKAFANSAQTLLNNWVIPFIRNNRGLIKTVFGLLAGFFALKLAFLGMAYAGSMVVMPLRTLITGFAKLRAMGSMFRLLRVGGAGKGIALLRTFGMSAETAARTAGLFNRALAPFSAAFARIGAGAGVFGKLNIALGIAGRGILFLGKALLTTPIGWITLAIAAAAFLIYKYWGPIKSFFIGIWEGIKEGFAPALPLLEAFWNGLKELGAVVAEVFEPLIGWFDGFLTANTEASAEAQNFGHLIGAVLGGLLAAVVQTGAMIIDGWCMIFDVLFSVVDSVWTQIKTAFNGGLTGILGLILNWSPIGAFYSSFAAVLSWFGIELPAKFTEFGRMILDGLINGIKSKIGEAVQTVQGLATRLKGAFTSSKSMDIHSPSRVFMRFGGWMMEGLQIGLGNGSARPLTAIGSVAADLQQRFKNRSGTLSAELAASMQANSAEFAAARQAPTGGAVTIHFNPTINASGGVDANQLLDLLRRFSGDELQRLVVEALNRHQEDLARRAY